MTIEQIPSQDRTDESGSSSQPGEGLAAWSGALRLCPQSALRAAGWRVGLRLRPIRLRDFGRIDASVIGWPLLLITIALATCVSAQEDTSSSPRASASKENAYSASVYSEIRLGYLAQGTWCYESEPAFIFSSGQTLLRADLKGNVGSLLEAPEYFGSAGCSQDGRTISFFSHPNVGDPTLRLSILDTRSNEKAEYTMLPPASAGPSFEPPGRSLMSLDGTVFALPSNPVLVSGPDLLREKKVIIAESGDVFWTSKFVFVREGEHNRYRMRQIPSLRDIGTIELPQDRIIKNIVECRGVYFAHYLVDALQQEMLEPIIDLRLGGKRAAAIKDVGSVFQNTAGCTVVLTRDVSGKEEIQAVEVIDQNSNRIVGLSKFDRLGYVLTISKDGQFLLGNQMLGLPSEASRKSRIVVLRIKP